MEMFVKYQQPHKLEDNLDVNISITLPHYIKTSFATALLGGEITFSFFFQTIEHGEAKTMLWKCSSYVSVEPIYHINMMRCCFLPKTWMDIKKKTTSN